jgi:5-methylcytosine-specific restriction enzyme subunit McrC
VSEPRLIDVQAWSLGDDVPLSLDEIAEIERSGLAEVVHGVADGRFRVKTSSRIGLVVGDGWELRVMPHLPIPRLMFLLGYALDEQGWKDRVAGFEQHDDLFTAIATAFSWHSTWALDRGVLRGYVHRDERRIDLRGRIRFGDHIARSGGLPLPVDVSYDDFTDDVLENRMLRTAASLLLRLPRVPLQTRRRLLRMRALLADVTELPQGSRQKAPPITRLNDRYEGALVLAELVLAAASTGASRDVTKATTFVFDMNKVFEDFVTTALGEALRRHGGELRSQVTARRLSEHISLRPDLAWWRNGHWEALLDVKYKPLYSEAFPNADAYQMLAYTLAFGLDKGWLVYAREPHRESVEHFIPSAAKTIVVTALDVTREPDDLLAEVDALADRVAASAHTLVAAAA